MSPRLHGVQPVLASRDVAASVRYYVDRLGFRLVFQDDPAHPRYAGVQRDGVELHLQWHDAAEWKPGADRPNYRFVVDDVDALHAELTARGITERITPVSNTPWGTREFHVQDPDRNGLQFYRGL